MSTLDVSMAVWRKSSRSGGESGQCVEVASVSNVVAIRDSKHPDVAALAFDVSVFGAFVAKIRTGGHDR